MIVVPFNVTSEIKGVFNKKDSFIFLTLFERFTRLGREDKAFADFLRAFQSSFRYTRVNGEGLLFDEIDKKKRDIYKALLAAFSTCQSDSYT